MSRLFYSLVCVLFLSVSVTAQQEYVWEEYGIGFSLADDFEEVVNNADEFSAVGDGMEMAIIPFQDGSIDNNDITAYTMAVAASLELDRLDDVSVIKLNGFKGGYAEGVLSGEKIFLMGLIDPNSDTNFFVIITFLDNDQNAINEAVAICKSFYKL